MVEKMIDFLRFLFFFTIVPVTPSCLILIEYLRYFDTIYSINSILYYTIYVLIYVVNCVFWGAIVYNNKKIGLFIKKILKINSYFRV